MRARHEPHFLKVSHYISDSRGAQIEARKFRKRARPYRLAFADIPFYQGLEQNFRALIKHAIILHQDLFPRLDSGLRAFATEAEFIRDFQLAVAD
jgi:hypothetical protein